MNRMGLSICALFLMGVVFGPWAYGQEPDKPKQNSHALLTRVVELKYADVARVASALRGLGFAGSVVPEPQSRTLALRASADDVSAMEAVIRKLDVLPPPAKNIELTAFLLVALEAPRTDLTLPANLEPVVKQLRATFSYKSYQLLETLVVRNRDGETGSVTGVVPSSTSTPLKTFYSFTYRSSKLSAEPSGNMIRIDGLNLGARIPLPVESGETQGTKVQYQNTGVSTNVDVREGQMVVVGKANVDGSNNALVIVLSARVAE